MKDGRPFWSLPKRPPSPLDATSEQFTNFVAAAACLRAKIFNIEIPDESRVKETKEKFAELVKSEAIPDFTPNDSKAQEIAILVEK